ncbi:Enolpyruvate transferase domain [Macleaya cordata]|uniref:UDP-N-acetylglucosamine 1-carboxyvinyltransferase n=1 Tax=Macleaya cordata TaxID=56857 RepID=A0A200QS72_MACCD|nr:Enolpyruvate transferase domain [Macleaya cordata]
MAAIFNPRINLSHSIHHKPNPHFLRKTSPLSLLSTLESPIQTPPPDKKLVIVGGSKLSGHVNISGSKNSALAILAGTLCCSGTSKLHNIPNLSDITTMVSVLRSLGARIEVLNGEITVDTDGLCSSEPCSDSVRKIRGGFFVLGPILARFGEAMVALPGGCDIGARPIDLYIRGLRALGAVVELICAHAANGRGLVGGSFRLDYPSVGATETLMMAASMADGKTVLSNVAKEPEVVDLAQFLNASGACVEGAGSSTLVINGRKRLHGPEHTVIPDRIEAGTFMIAAAITRSCFSMSPVTPLHLSCLIEKLSAAGCKIRRSSSYTMEISALPSKIEGGFIGFDVRTGPFPQFPTDLQPQVMALLTTCTGSSSVEESVFEGRMRHVRELEKLGARIRVCGSTALVNGKEQGSALYGSHVVATDLRCGASLVLAGMAAEGITEVEGVKHIDRGYEDLETKLKGLGADISRQQVPLATQLIQL